MFIDAVMSFMRIYLGAVVFQLSQQLGMAFAIIHKVYSDLANSKSN